MVEPYEAGDSGIKWGATARRANGDIIVRVCAVQPPKALTCIKLSCILKYMKATLKYTLLLLYHKRRVMYAAKNRETVIDMKYRLGEPSPVTFQGIMWEVFKLLIRG